MTPGDLSLLPFVPLLPLASFAVLLFFGKRMGSGAAWIGVAAVLAALGISLDLFFGAYGAADPRLRLGSAETGLRVEWLRVGGFELEAGIHFDNLTAVMLVVVTLVSFLVHLYSTAYMHGDPRYTRYFAYLGLFTLSMLGLVLADDLFFLFVFWELVGVSSYLLIGFWFEKTSAANASKKAFLVNRVGDFGFLLGLLLLFRETGTLDMAEIFDAVANGRISDASHVLGIGTLTLAGCLVFLGAVGKSAQVPLHVWLPDAMEGPTPVSALIHAATMVAAGVYMVGRLFPIFTPVALACIAVVGAGTALLAATIGIVQNDIKKVLAYSTVSQLGFMIMGLGAGGYAAGLFHLTTHAFFKALLFLGAGSVIHAMHHEQDMQRMGGLRSKLPITFGTMLVATLAIAGFWPFSGFFSKDAILAQVLSRFHEGGPWRIPAVFALLGATITSFYMFRLVFLTFFGRPRDAHAYDHAHESPWAMTAPLVLLAVLSVGSAWPKLGEGEARTSWFEHMLPAPPGAAAAGALARQGTLAGAHEAEHAGVEEAAAAHGGAHAYHALAVALGSAVAALGFLLAFATYVRGWISADAWAKRLAPLYDLLVHKYYFDEFYEGVVVRALLVWNELLRRFDVWVIDGLVNLTALVTRVLAGIQGAFDRHVVDGLVNGTASTAQALGRVARSVQTGSLGTYLALMVAGCLALMTLVVVLA